MPRRHIYTKCKFQWTRQWGIVGRSFAGVVLRICHIYLFFQEQVHKWHWFRCELCSNFVYGWWRLRRGSSELRMNAINQLLSGHDHGCWASLADNSLYQCLARALVHMHSRLSWIPTRLRSEANQFVPFKKTKNPQLIQTYKSTWVMFTWVKCDWLLLSSFRERKRLPPQICSASSLMTQASVGWFSGSAEPCRDSAAALTAGFFASRRGSSVHADSGATGHLSHDDYTEVQPAKQRYGE